MNTGDREFSVTNPMLAEEIALIPLENNVEEPLLDIKDNEPPPRVIIQASRWRCFMVDMYWKEKICMIIDYLQLYTIVWNAAQPWPWPYLWSTWTRWMVYINVDIFSSLDGGALAGSSNSISSTFRWGQYNGKQTTFHHLPHLPQLMIPTTTSIKTQPIPTVTNLTVHCFRM